METAKETVKPEQEIVEASEETAQPADAAETEQHNSGETKAPAQAPTDQPGKQKKKRSPMGPIQTFFLNALLVITMIWLLFGFVFGFCSVPNNDMAPNFKAGDLVLYYRISDGYAAQEVVVLEKNNTTYVGRVVARSGDTVEITDTENLVINGNTMVEDNIYGTTPRFEGALTYPVTLGADEYFVLVDGRAGGEDSRYYGVVSGKEIDGKVLMLMRRNHL